MKKLITLALACVALASCSKENEEGVELNAPVEIKLNAGIEGMARAEITKITGATDVQFVRVDGATPSWTTVTDISTTGSIAESTGTISLTTKQYYPTDGSNANILGFFPVATSITNGVASMTIDGEKDLIYAQPVFGTKGTPMSNLAFNHLLTQFKFVIIRDGATTNTDITNVSVKLENMNTTCDLALANGTLSNWGTPTFSSEAISTGTASTTASTPTAGIMLEPNLSSINVTVSATGYTSTIVPIAGTDDNSFKAGKAYTITLTFKGTEIPPTATITEWGTGTATGGDVK